MGTGTVSILASLFYFGYDTTVLKVITLVFFFINLSSYVAILAMSIARYFMFPEVYNLHVVYDDPC